MLHLVQSVWKNITLVIKEKHAQVKVYEYILDIICRSLHYFAILTYINELYSVLHQLVQNYQKIYLVTEYFLGWLNWTLAELTCYVVINKGQIIWNIWREFNCNKYSFKL